MRKKQILSCDEAVKQLLLKDRRFQLTLTAVKKARRPLFAQQNQFTYKDPTTLSRSFAFYDLYLSTHVSTREVMKKMTQRNCRNPKTWQDNNSKRR